MPSKPRKKWKVTYRYGQEHTRTATSQTKAYEIVHGAARSSVANDPTAIATIWVDEGDSRGWQRYDEVNLHEVAQVLAAQQTKGE